MNIFLNPASTPPAVQLKATGSPLASMRLKRGAVVPLVVTILGVQNATNLRFGIKSAHEGEMLALAAADSGTPADNGTTFTLSLEVRSNALDAALHVGDAESSLSKLVCMAEFAWMEDGQQRLSDTISTTILNDIVRLASESPEALSALYPAPELLASKAWVRELRASSAAAGLVLLESDAVLEGEHTAVALTAAGAIAIPKAARDTDGTVRLGTDEVLSGLYILPVGKDAQGRLAVDASGLSAYDLAVKAGFVGTAEDWLASLKGEPGEDGASISTAELEAMLTSHTEEDIRTTPNGTDNATANYIELDAAYSPKGTLRSIAFRCGSTSATGMTTAPLYLAVWELVEGSATQYELAGVSSNAITQAINTTPEWSFEGVELHGRGLRLIATTDAAQPDNRTAMLRLRCSTSPDESACYYNNSRSAIIPKVTLTATRRVLRFASATAFAEHEQNTSAHLTEAQGNILAAFEWDSTYGLSLIHSTDGTVDGRLRFIIGTGSTTCMTSGTLTLQTPHFATIGRTAYAAYADTSGNSYSFSGHTLSNSEMAAYGITEPCVWAGDPLLPLILRGSSIRINGQTIDTAALLELLAHKDDILAALSEPVSQSADDTTDEIAETQPPGDDIPTPDASTPQN